MRFVFLKLDSAMIIRRWLMNPGIWWRLGTSLASALHSLSLVGWLAHFFGPARGTIDRFGSLFVCAPLPVVPFRARLADHLRLLD